MTNKGKLIGKGLFSRVYRNLNEKIVTIVSSDLTKECYCYASYSRLFPNMRQIDQGVYQMEYLERKSSLKNNLTPCQWRLYKKLRSIHDYIAFKYPRNPYDYHSFLYEVFSEKMPSEFSNEKEQILQMLDNLADYGSDICFEISPRNVAVKSKKLIMLDCFFFRSQLEEKTGLY